MRVEVKFQEKDKKFGANMGRIHLIHDGENGATFTPSVSPDGVISWTNDRELENPSPVNIKGVKGDKGEQGKQGVQGNPGKDGVSPVITIQNGYWYINGVNTNQKAQGANGKDGTNGEDGYTPQKGVDYYTAAEKADIVAAVKEQLITEQWTFTLMDGTVITKEVVSK